MRIISLELTNFRSYENLSWMPGEETNVIEGPNGSGKSNLAEAIYMAATTKSHRTSKDSEVIRIGKPFCRVACDVARDKDNDVLIEVIIEKGGKAIKLNKSRQHKISEAIGQLKAVIFSASDVEMIKGEPALRRRFMNLEISQTRIKYCIALANYKRVLEQRNSLLKDCAEGKCNAAELSAWDRQLVSSGSVIIAQREEFCREISVLAKDIYSELCGNSETLQIRYEPNIKPPEDCSAKEIEEKFAEAVSQARTAEIARGSTLRGPQRDDMSASIDGMDLRYYGSRGQQRSAALAIKLAEAELVFRRAGEYPVVLLDDVASELDPERRERALGMLKGKCQSILTTASAAELPGIGRMKCRVFQVKEGKMEESPARSTH